MLEPGKMKFDAVDFCGYLYSTILASKQKIIRIVFEGVTDQKEKSDRQSFLLVEKGLVLDIQYLKKDGLVPVDAIQVFKSDFQTIYYS